MIEEAKALPALLKANATSYAADVLCRAVLETASLARWLLDPDIDAQRRGVRWLVYRLHTARETEKAVTALELDPPGEDRSGYGESVADVQKEINSLGWRAISESVAFGVNKEPWLGYTDRVAKLVRNIALMARATVSEGCGQARMALRVVGRFHGWAGGGQTGGVRRRSARRC